MLAPFQLLISMATTFPSLGFVLFWSCVGVVVYRITAP